MVLITRSLAVTLLLILPISSTVVSDGDASFRQLDGIVIKGIEHAPSSGSLSDLGHYWIEIYDAKGKLMESYGWYPSRLDWDKTPWDDTWINAVGGVPGILNAGHTQDPTAIEVANGKLSADWEYHPVLTNSLSDDEVLNNIREFAKTYKGDWALWRSCHDFVKDLMNSVGLIDPDKHPGLLFSMGYASLSQAGLSQPTPDEYEKYVPDSSSSSGSSSFKVPTEAEFPTVYEDGPIDLPCV